MKSTEEKGTDMVEGKVSPEPIIAETENIIQESRERIRKALELESNRLKEKAERDSAQIIAEAKKEADKTVAHAREEAKAESERIIAKAKEEAEQGARKSREEEEKARQESVRVIDQTREKALRIIAEVFENGTKKAQSDFARVASEVKDKTSQLLGQVSRSLEQIIAEAETRVKDELEHLPTAIPAVETNPESPNNKMPGKEAEANSRPATQEATTPITPVIEKTKPEVPPIAEKRSVPGKEGEGGKLFKGRLKLEIVSPFNQTHQGGVQEWLGQVRGVKIISTGGHAGVNRWITNQTIDLEEPMPLLDILKSVPAIKDIAAHKDNIVITVR